MQIELLKINDVKPYKNNAKIHTKEQIQQIKKSIEQFGMNDPIAIWGENNIIVEGHGRLEALKQLGYKEVECIRLDHLTDEERKAYTLAHNKLTMNTDFDIDVLNNELLDIEAIDMSDFGFDSIDDLLDDNTVSENEHGKLIDEFIVPPLSIFDTRKGYWQDRKKMWKNMGIKSENGRDVQCISATFNKMRKKQMPETSIFDPVLCEIMYKWFCIEKGKIFDCFAGGSVRGIVASKLNYDYTGIDLRQEQIDANYLNANELGIDNIKWICDDSLNADKYVEDNSVDMIFSCPPYADLEVYSDDERDISNMDYEKFKEVYKKIIDIACKKLKENRFAVFVVGDIRDKNGNYRNFIDYTKECFNKNGLNTYNEIILLDMFGTSMIRCKKPFNSNRKVTKVHQNVLVFYKGDIKEIKNNYKKIEIEDINPLDI